MPNLFTYGQENVTFEAKNTNPHTAISKPAENRFSGKTHFYTIASSPTNSVKSNYSRPPSVDNLFPEATSATQVPLAKMDQAKCAVGAACLDDKLLVCGEFLLPCKQICSRSEAIM